MRLASPAIKIGWLAMIGAVAFSLGPGLQAQTVWTGNSVAEAFLAEGSPANPLGSDFMVFERPRMASAVPCRLTRERKFSAGGKVRNLLIENELAEICFTLDDAGHSRAPIFIQCPPGFG
jgi:hypothetical protein